MKRWSGCCSNVDKTIVETPGRDALSSAGRESGEPRRGEAANDRRLPPPSDRRRPHRLPAADRAASAASRSFRKPRQGSSPASASRCGSSTATSRRAISSEEPAPGLAFRIPFAESIVWIDKRVRDLDMDKQQVLSTDQRRLEVDAFARYRVVDPLRMYIAARSDRSGRAGARADPRLAAEERAGQATVRVAAVARARRRDGAISASGSTALPANMASRSSTSASRRLTLPDGTPLQSAYDRMRTARQQEARSIEAEGAEARPDHPRRGRCRSGAHLCRGVRQGPGILQFLPGDAVLSDDLPGPNGRASPPRPTSYCRQIMNI